MWDFLKKNRFNLITWNQRDPNGSYQLVLEELKAILKVTRKRFPDSPIVLIGHSRGGLVIRKYIQTESRPVPIRKVILLGSPNRGSQLASFAARLNLLAGFWKGFFDTFLRIPGVSRQRITRKFSAMLADIKKFLKGKAIVEMKPSSALIRSLRKREQKEKKSHIPYVNLAGNSNVFTRLYLVRRKNKIKEIFSFLDDLPDWLVFEELDDGKGDGLVSVARAGLSWIPTEIFPVNHATFLIDSKIRRRILKECKKL